MKIGDTVTFYNHAGFGHDPVRAVVDYVNPTTGAIDIRTEDGNHANNVAVLNRSLSPVGGNYCHEMAPAPLTLQERVTQLEEMVTRLETIIDNLASK